MLRQVAFLAALASVSAFTGQLWTSQSLARRLPAFSARPLKRRSRVNMMDDFTGPFLAAMPGTMAIGAMLGRRDFGTAGMHLEWSAQEYVECLCMCP